MHWPYFIQQQLHEHPYHLHQQTDSWVLGNSVKSFSHQASNISPLEAIAFREAYATRALPVCYYSLNA